jgi:iron-sulfur cluster assembly protein
MMLTQAAAERIKVIMAAKGTNVVGARIGVNKGGCAGMEYTMTWADKPDPFDEVVEDKGARVLVDPKAVLYLLGTEMDYRVDRLASRFVFNNPNQKSACGCGESIDLVPAGKEEARGAEILSAKAVAVRSWQRTRGPSGCLSRRPSETS